MAALEKDLDQNVFHYVAVNVRQPEIAARITIRQLRMIETHRVQHRRVKIVDRYPVLDRLEAEVIRRSVC